MDASQSKYNLPVMGISLSVLIAALDTSIANTALPEICSALKILSADSIWIVMIYHIALAAVMLPLVTLGEIIGYRKILSLGIILFTISSLLCGISGNFYFLVISRFFQGIGAAAILGSNTALIKMMFSQNKIGKALGYNALVIATGFSLGPTISSIVLSISSWHWLFLLNIPIGILAFLLIYKKLPLNSDSTRSFNFLDNLKIGMCFILLFLGLDFLKDDNNIFYSLILIGISIALIVNLYLTSLSQQKPAFPFDLLKNKNIAFSILGTVTAFFIQSVSFLTLPFVFSQILKMPATLIGYLITPWPGIAAFIAPLSGSLSDKISPTKLSITGLAILSLGLLSLTMLSVDISYFLIVGCMLICGVGFGFFQSPNIKNVMSSVSIERGGSASGLLGISRVFGQALGSLFLSTYLSKYGIQSWHNILYFGITSGILGIIFLSFKINIMNPNT